MIVFVLHREISDQMGTDESVGVYSDRAKAEQASESIARSRTYIKEMTVDSAPIFRR